MTYPPVFFKKINARVILDGPRATIPAREGPNMACESLKNRMPGYTFYWIS